MKEEYQALFEVVKLSQCASHIAEYLVLSHEDTFVLSVTSSVES